MNTAGLHSLIDELKQQNVQLIAISKTKPAELIREMYEAGQRVFGENRAQEMAGKHEELPTDIEWHMVGRLQSNKVKYIAPFVHLIHSVDSLKLLKEIDRQGARNNRIISCLLQVHIAKEETKAGLYENELKELLQSDDYRSFEFIAIRGLMGMATFTNDENIMRQEFSELSNMFSSIKNDFFKEDLKFKEISMGMSSDYKIAIEEGSTMVRIGTMIFGARN